MEENNGRKWSKSETVSDGTHLIEKSVIPPSAGQLEIVQRFSLASAEQLVEDMEIALSRRLEDNPGAFQQIVQHMAAHWESLPRGTIYRKKNENSQIPKLSKQIKEHTATARRESFAQIFDRNVDHGGAGGIIFYRAVPAHRVFVSAIPDILLHHHFHQFKRNYTKLIK